MRSRPNPVRDDLETRGALRAIADSAFSRAAGAPLITGNHVRLLKDAQENYPAWLEAINGAQRHIHFESYVIHSDEVGVQFSDALIEKARQGVQVRVIYDWMGDLWQTSHGFWSHLRDNGVEVRCYNPPRFSSPIGWLSRDHRKMISVDGSIAFITGLCVGKAWVGDSKRKIDPWRDTGIEVRGPAVAEVEEAFAHIWSMIGDPIPPSSVDTFSKPAGDMAMRIVATLPATAGMFRFDQLVSTLARKRLWLTDAYYAGVAAYVQALRAAARDGVDVRLLVPNGTDVPILRPLTRAGYRPLLEAGVRVFEWNGTMVHAKTAVADGQWARVGSTNLNIASWLSNCELDAVIEDESFAAQMEEMYLEDLENTTEVVLDAKQKVRPVHPQPRRPKTSGTSSGGTVRAAAGAIRIGNTIGAAFTDRRVLEPADARTTIVASLVLCALGVLFIFFPHALAYPLIVFMFWVGIALFCRGVGLYKRKNGPPEGQKLPASER